MKPFILTVTLLVFITASLFTTEVVAQSSGEDAKISSLSDDEIRDLMIEKSISGYSGSCPCPYNRARNGSRCGKRSAYSKPGGYSPFCYRSDVSDKAVENYRKRK